MKHTELTVKEFARKERVQQRTVWRWIAKGAVDVRRTPGGRVRIPMESRQASGAIRDRSERFALDFIVTVRDN